MCTNMPDPNETPSSALANASTDTGTYHGNALIIDTLRGVLLLYEGAFATRTGLVRSSLRKRVDLLPVTRM